MSLFWAAIGRDSVSLLRFPFLSHVQVFSCEMSLVCHLKCPYSCFSTHFLFSMYFCSVDACIVCEVSGSCNQSSSTNFSPPFLDTYNLSTSSPGCKALYIVMGFLVLWFICWSSSLFLFKNGPEYLTIGTVQVFIPLMRFLQCCLVSSSFLVLLKYWKKFFHVRFLMVSAFNISKYLSVSFSLSVLIFSWFGSSISSVMRRFPLFIINTAHFSMPNPIPISSLYILTACIRVSNSSSFLANSLISSMYIRWMIFFLRFMKFVLPVHFQNMWLTSSLLQIVMVMAHLTERLLPGFFYIR